MSDIVKLPLPLQFERQYAASVEPDFSLTNTQRTAYLQSAIRYAGMIVFDTDEGKLYTLNAAKDKWLPIGEGDFPVWNENENYPLGKDVKEYDAELVIFRAFTRTQEPLPEPAPYPKPTEDVNKTYYIPWYGSGGTNTNNRIHNSVFGPAYN